MYFHFKHLLAVDTGFVAVIWRLEAVTYITILYGHSPTGTITQVLRVKRKIQFTLKA